MKVLWITERFAPDRGGVAISSARQVAALAPGLERIDVLRLSAELPAARVDVAELAGARVFRVGRATEADESLQLLAQTARNLLTAHGHDLVHGFYAVPAGYVAALVARERGLPSVVSLRGNDVDRAMFHGPRLALLLSTLERATALAGVSREILGRVRALCGREHRLFQVPNGVDTELFRPRPGPASETPALAGAPRPWLAFAGEARLKKGLPALQELAQLLAARGRGTLVLVGGVRKEERAAAEAWARANPRAAARVRELPYERDRERLAGLLSGMDLFVFPSLWEGMPNAALEAMGCARPVLASAVGAFPELLEDGRNGFLVDPADLARFPERALALLEPGAEQLGRVGAAARETVLRGHSLEAERRALLSVYEALRR